MSLFNQTYARADKAEKELDAANRKIASLESSLKAKNLECEKLRESLSTERVERTKDAHSGIEKWRNQKALDFVDLAKRAPGTTSPRAYMLNSLSEEEVKIQFAKMAEQEDAADLKSAAPWWSVSVRSRLLAPISKLLGGRGK